jgi:TonB-dependent receptor
MRRNNAGLVPGVVSRLSWWVVVAASALAAHLACSPAYAADAGTSTDQSSPPAAAPAPAATATTTAAAPGENLQEIVVTGVRKSLTDAANAKREATNFSDSIFAEDVAKFSDNNVAEALNRVPGVIINRDVDGVGTQISIRGLGPSFTKILLNGTQIAVASDGSLDAGNSNREVDLDLFPTELFTKFTIDKTPLASELEGGISGTVNMVNARPFDNVGPHVAANFAENYGTSSQEVSPRASVIASDTWGPFGALIGLSGSETHERTDGFESIGWTTPNLSAAQCNLPTCNTIGGKGYSFPATVPVNAGAGLVAGTPVNAAFLAANNPNVSLLQLGNSLMPRLGRDEFLAGTKDRESILVALEFRPTDSMHFNLDMLYGHKIDNFNRLDEDWSLRNSNFMVPLNVNVDSNDVVTSGTYANAQFFLEARPYQERLNFYNINPSFEWDISDKLKLQGQVNDNLSTFYRQEPSFLFNSPLDSGSTVTYTNNGGSVPTIVPSLNLNNPSLGWTWNRENIQNVHRDTLDKGTHWDLTMGDDKANLKVGFAYDGTYRSITAFDGSAAYSNCVINGTATTVNGVVVPCAGNTSLTTGTPLVPNATLSGYLEPGPASNFYHIGSGNLGYTSFIQPNYGKLLPATNFGYYNSIAAFSATSAQATPSGTIDERNTGAYIEFNGKGQFWNHDVAYNAGIRYVDTDQVVSQLVSVNGATLLNKIAHPYDSFLPSFNIAANVRDDLILRIAGSRSMTRPNPNSLLPGTTFSDPSAQVATAGNANLQPYYSDNADLGLEWYMGGPGYISADFFYKAITGFTEIKQVTEPFSALGIPLASLAAIQLATGITDATLISVNTPVNIDQAYIKGGELIWVQPLDFITRGLGITSNYTHVTSKSFSQGAPLGVLPGIPSYTYNVGGYYEAHNISLHITYVYNASLVAAPAPQNNVNLPLIADARGELDFSADYTLPKVYGVEMQVTFDGINVTNAPLRTVFGYENAPYSVYFPGAAYELGLRAKF